MLALVCVAVGMVWVGAFLVEEWLEERPILFLAFWGLLGWIVIFLIVLSLYDMVRIRRAIANESDEA
ncbi:MAG: hypothetical protein AAGA96_07330 [Verrucomicrobiota bacterium]